jgi:hypothetical protein
MKKVIFNREYDEIKAGDVKLDRNKIYAYNTGSEMKFLTKTNKRYRWTTLFVDGGTARGIMHDGYDNFRDAIMACSDLKVMIFENQRELLTYVKSNF